MANQFSQSVGGNVTGNLVGVQGDGNRVDNMAQIQTNADGIPTQPEVTALLAQLQQLIEEAHLPTEVAEEGLAYLGAAQRQAQKPDPNRNSMQGNLEDLAQTLEQGSETLEAGQKLWGKAQPILLKIGAWLGVAAGSILLGS
jgi:hypothetical protein